MVWSPPHTMPTLVTTFQMRQQYEASKAMRVARTVTRTTPVPVIVGTLETRRKHEGLKVTTATWMAALRCQKLRQLRGWRLTVDTFEALGGATQTLNPQTFRPKPSTLALSPKAHTLNPKPQSPQPKPYTQSSKTCTLNPKPLDHLGALSPEPSSRSLLHL